jgi:SAM-dependent methyltransferase
VSSDRKRSTVEPVEPHPVMLAYYCKKTQRADFVRNLFNETAHHYDRINRLFSMGSGAWYRRHCLRRAGLQPGMRLLDVAIGTGLVARQAVALCGTGADVIGLDLSESMLAEARRTLDIPLVQGMAEDLPLADASVDFITMGYALRHVADLTATFREWLILGFGVLDLVSGDQCVNQGAQECLAPLAGVMNELEEPEVDGEFLLRNAAMRAQPGAQQ